MSETSEIPSSVVEQVRPDQGVRPGEADEIVGEINKARPSRLSDLLRILRREKRNGDEQEVSNLSENAEQPDLQTERSSTEQVEEVRPENQIETETDPVEQNPTSESVESSEIVRAQQLIGEITREVKDWGSIESGNVDQAQVEQIETEPDLMTLSGMRDEVRQRLFVNVSSKIIGAEYRARYLIGYLDSALEGAQGELDLKRNIRRDFRTIQVLDATMENAALETAEVLNKEQLKELSGKARYEIFSDLDPAQRDLVWEVVSPYLERAGRLNDDARASYMEHGGLDSSWYSGSFWSSSDQFEILQEIRRRAIDSGNTELAEKMRVRIAGYGVGITEKVAKDREEFYPEIAESFSDRSREELLRHGVNLAQIVDREQPQANERAKMAVELGVDPSELSFLHAHGSNREEFLEKLITGSLSVPLSEQPEYFRRFLARELHDFIHLDRLATTFPIEKIPTGEFFRVLGERLSVDSVIAERAQARVREIQILGDAPSMATRLRADARIELLVRKIGQSADWQRLGKKFDAIVARGDEFGLAWEFLSLNPRGRSGLQLKDQINEIPGKVAGLPENLQWANLSREQRKRLLVSWAQDEETLSAGSLNVEDLSPLGEAFVTKAVLREVIGQSQDSESKSKADARNREIAASGKATLRTGDLMHGTDVKNLAAILTGGDRASEFLGLDQKNDFTPLAADFSEVLETETSGEFKYSEKATFLPAEEQRRIFQENPFKAIYLGSIAVQYGAREKGMHTSQDAVSSPETGITLIFDRQRPDAFLRGLEYRGHMREHHALVFVGLPATEISGIINGRAEATIAKAKSEIVANGFYIPLYNLDGEVIFRPEEYDAMRSIRA